MVGSLFPGPTVPTGCRPAPARPMAPGGGLPLFSPGWFLGVSLPGIPRETFGSPCPPVR
jgi:hypothetical protein